MPVSNLFYFAMLGVVAVVAWVGQWGRTNDICRYAVYTVMAISAIVLLVLGLLCVVFHETMLGILMLAMGACALPTLLPPVRKGLAKSIFPGLEADNPAHTWALYMFLAALALTTFSITVLYMPAVIIAQLKTMPLYETVILNTLVFVVFAFLAVGVGINQSFREAAARLGFGKLTRKQVGLMILTALVLAVSIQYVEMGLMTLVSPHTRETLQQIVKALHTTGSVGHTIRSAVIVGLAAGIGEETLFRGLMQPVFGLIPTAILFTLIHTHYGPTPLLLELFMVGLLLGYVRKRWNTTAAIIVHSGFDFFAILSTFIHH